ncbi:MAG: malto-oligosyltrehalose synthase [Polaromonas sp.]|nr:malto-oligosyltrehalose synthase [Polaromonas sp.]
MSLPRATVRLQLHREFTFDDAAATIDYYADLGISHFYLSPVFVARAGSTHGYDVTDPTRINPELGGEDAFRRLVTRLRAAGMGAIIDIVPNHMGVASADNRYWQHVLAWGEQSAYAHWFDIDWQHPDPRLTGKLLLPVLGEPYEDALAAGVLGIRFDAASGRLSLACYDGLLPLSAASYSAVLAGQHLFADTADRLASLRESAVAPAHAQLATLAATPEGRQAMARALARFAPGAPGAVPALNEVLARQHYRLSWWRNAAEEINWRRFFEVSDLAGLCVEKDDVFEATHALVFDLYRQGLIDGLRMDHVDGLADPGAYCRRVRARLSALQAGRPDGLREDRAWIVVEKILTPGESLPQDWGVDGTTGYDFMDQAGAVLHDEAGETALRQLWTRLTGDAAAFEDHLQAAREQLLAENFVGEVDALARLLQRYAASIGHAGRDLAPPAIRRVLVALLSAFRRYRVYAGPDGVLGEEDIGVLQAAVDAASHRLHFHDHALLQEVAQWLGLPPVPATGDATLRLRALTRFQQLTPPLAAKSLEDTVFYRHAPLLSRNDVGSYPDEDAASFAGADGRARIAAFHAANLQRARQFPHSMLATATHDHKRGEDTRARLAVLTEMPGTWGGLLADWMSAHGPLRATVPLPGSGLLAAPAPADEVMLYQAILGAWPEDLRTDDAGGLRALAKRLAAWQEKALREAKLYSSWMLPHQAYEAGCRAFLDSLLCSDEGATFRAQMRALVEQVTPAARANALSQTLLRLLSPGVPDLYQGCDRADFSLVDPDNRRPVDMALRQAVQPDWPPAQPWTDSLQPGAKQALIRQVLGWRRAHPGVVDGGSYQALDVEGGLASHVVAFHRSDMRPGAADTPAPAPAGARQLIAVAMRKPAGLIEPTALSGGMPGWADTRIALPAGFPRRWRDVLTGASIPSAGGMLLLEEVLRHATVAMLVPVDIPLG